MNYTDANTNNAKPGARRLPVRVALAAAVAIAWFTLAAPAARAVSVSYDFSISSNYSLLMSPQSSSAQSQVKQMSSAVVDTANNNPVIMITNTSMTADISDVKITLTDPDSVFNALKLLQNPLGATPAAPFTNNIWGGSTNMVNIALPTPLAPNQSLVFAVNLGPLGGFPNHSFVPGFENILFQNPSASNAQLAVTYFDPSNPTNTQTLNSVLPSLTTMTPLVTVMSSCCNTPSTSVLETSFGVPEPSSILLLGLGVLTLGMPAWKRYMRSSSTKSQRTI